MHEFPCIPYLCLRTAHKPTPAHTNPRERVCMHVLDFWTTVLWCGLGGGGTKKARWIDMDAHQQVL
jgi:hypothetical protein